MLTRRPTTPELMDDPDIDRGQLEQALGFIRLVNRRLGGTSAALRRLKRWSRRWPRGSARPIRILDLGTGSADIPLAIAEWARRARLSVHITAVDMHPATLDLARQHIGARDDIELVQADARRLMDLYAAESFDYAHAGMFLHHLEDIEVVTVLRIMDRLTRRGAIWNDLERSLLSRAGVRVLTLGAPKHVRHDAIVSVQKGFTRLEALDLARRAGWPAVQFRRHLFGRFTLTSLKHAAG
jgi:hypothetical protein